MKNCMFSRNEKKKKKNAYLCFVGLGRPFVLAATCSTSAMTLVVTSGAAAAKAATAVDEPLKG